MSGFSIDCDLIFLLGGGRTFAFGILIDALKEVFILGLIDELAFVVEAYAVMRANLIDDGCWKVVSNTVDLAR